MKPSPFLLFVICKLGFCGFKGKYIQEHGSKQFLQTVELNGLVPSYVLTVDAAAAVVEDDAQDGKWNVGSDRLDVEWNDYCCQYQSG